MKPLVKILVLCCVALSSLGVLRANVQVPGTEYWFAVPPNEYDGYSNTRQLEVYVTSRFDTEVTLNMPGTGLSYTKAVKANTITTFNTEDGTMNWEMEVRASESVTNKGIQLIADRPFTAHMLSARTYTSEGCQLLPVSQLGTEYRHVSYYDYFEGNLTSARGGGFVIVATEDATVVNIDLLGEGNGPTVGGRTIGESLVVQLNKGDTYLLRGNGIDRSFDLTGSHVQSNKPIAFLSSHMRTIIPTTMGNGSRDYLVEMLTPVDQWGRMFVVREFARENRGDYFRLVADEDGTTWEVSWYDKITDTLIGNMTGELNAGEWFEYNETTPGFGVESIRGVSVWRTNKPCGLMQCSYSAGWDQSDIFDPFMIWIPPVDVMSRRLTFQTPANTSFINNYAQFIVVGDSLDNDAEKLKSVKIDNEYLFEMDPNLLHSRVPGTNYFHASVRVGPGPHSVRSNTRISCTMYGFATWESYGWFTVPVDFVGESEDTTPPTISIEPADSTVLIVVSDDDGTPDYSGLYWIELDSDQCENLSAETYFWIGDGSQIANTELEIAPVAADLDVVVVGVVEDLAGNTTAFRDTISSLTFYRPAVSLDLNKLEELTLLIGGRRQQTIVVNNTGNGSLYLDSLVSMHNSNAFLFDGAAQVIPIYQSQEIDIEFVGEMNPEFAHSDTLLLYTNAQVEPLEIPVACSVLPLKSPELVDLNGINESEFGPNVQYGMQVESGGLAVSIDSIAVPTGHADFSDNVTPQTIGESSTDMLSFSLTYEAVNYTFADVELFCSVDGTAYPEPLKTRISWFAVIGSVHDGIASQAKVHPQPSEDNVHIELEEDVHGKALVDVFDYQGRRVFTQEQQVVNGAMHLTHQLPQGTYNVRIILGDKLYSSKLLVK